MADAQTRELARRIANLEDWRRRSKTPTLGFSTIVGGALQVSDLEDLLTMVLGQQFDGTNGPIVLRGPKPPTPTAPMVTPGTGALTVYWDGTYEDGAVAPMDFTRVTIHCIPLVDYDPETFDPTDQTRIFGEFNHATGSERTIALPYVEHVVVLVAWSLAGRFSDASEAGTGTPMTLGLPDIQGDIEELISNAQSDADTAMTSASGKNRINFRTTPPDSTFPGQPGDITWVRSGNTIIGQYLCTTGTYDVTGNTWVAQTLTSATISSLDAGSISTGFMSAARLDARTITVDKLLVTGTENLFNDPKFLAKAGGVPTLGITWDAPAAWSINTTGGRDGGNALVCTHVNGTTDSNWTRPSDALGGLPVVAGGSYRIGFWVKASVTDPGAVIPTVRWKNDAGVWAVVTVGTNLAVTAGSWVFVSAIWTAPTNATGFRPGIRVVSTAPSGTYTFSDPSCVRAANSELIVDGAVTATKLSADSIDGKTITGATLRTNSAGNRVVVRDDGAAGIIEFFGPDGVAGSVNPSSSTLEFKSPRSAAAVSAGYDPAWMYLGGQLGSNIPPRADLMLNTTKRYGNGSVGGDINAYGELRARQRLFVHQRDRHARERSTDLAFGSDSTWRIVGFNSLLEDTTTLDPNEQIVYNSGTFFTFTNRCYMVTAKVQFSGAVTTGKRGVRIHTYVDGSGAGDVWASQFVDAAASGQTHLSVSAIVDNVGLIQVEAYQDSGSNVDIMTGSNVVIRRLF